MQVFELNQRVVHMFGPDTVKFLDTIATQSFANPKPFFARNFLWLHFKGLILFAGTAIVNGEQAWIALDSEQAQPFIDSVNRSKLLFKTTVELQPSWTVTLACGQSDIAHPVNVTHPLAPSLTDLNNPVALPLPDSSTVEGFLLREPDGSISFWGEPEQCRLLAQQASTDGPSNPADEATNEGVNETPGTNQELATNATANISATANAYTNATANTKQVPEANETANASEIANTSSTANASSTPNTNQNPGTNEYNSGTNATSVASKNLAVTRETQATSAAPRGSTIGPFPSYESWRVANGKHSTTSELASYRPQELGLLPTHVHLAKGCYPGQETVAKQHNIGKPRRSLCVIKSEETISLTDTITTNNTQRGGIITSIQLPYALGFVPLTEGLLPEIIFINDKRVELVKRIGDGLKIPGNIHESRGY